MPVNPKKKKKKKTFVSAPGVSLAILIGKIFLDSLGYVLRRGGGGGGGGGAGGGPGEKTTCNPKFFWVIISNKN